MVRGDIVGLLRVGAGTDGVGLSGFGERLPAGSTGSAGASALATKSMQGPNVPSGRHCCAPAVPLLVMHATCAPGVHREPLLHPLAKVAHQNAATAKRIHGCIMSINRAEDLGAIRSQRHDTASSRWEHDQPSTPPMSTPPQAHSY